MTSHDHAQEFQRGDVVLVGLPFASDPTTTKERPAVIIQNNVGNRFSPNLIVAGITSQLPGKKYPTDFWVDLGSAASVEAGLNRTAVVKTDSILTIPKSSVRTRLGRFPKAAMADIDRCLRVSLAL